MKKFEVTKEYEAVKANKEKPWEELGLGKVVKKAKKFNILKFQSTL